jgi:hypothetical protein
MPFHLSPLSRRRFLQGAAALGAGLVLPETARAEVDPHRWALLADPHVVGLPPVGYVFAAGDPAGWVEARLHPQGCTMELRCLDPAHPKQGQLLELGWRPAA